jgi:DNA polymerase-3 subunit beta
MVQGVVEKRNTMPILSHVLLDCTDRKKLRLTATDLEVGITSLFNAKITDGGKVTLNIRNLTDITKQMPPKPMDFVLADGGVEISCGKSLYKLHGLPPEDFPSLPEVERKTGFSFPAEDLATMIDHTAFSISLDETRYNLSGVFLEQIDEGALRMVSSDGHRLSIYDRKIPNIRLKSEESIIIPRKGLMEIRKICEEMKGEVDFALSKSNCLISHLDTRLVIRLIDGEFPDYRQVLPTEENQRKILINRETFQDALRRISVLSQEKTRGVRFQFERDLLKITVNNPDVGEAQEEIEIKYSHTPLEIGFNAKYFLDVLSLLTVPEVELGLTDSMSQGMLCSPQDPSFRAVIMPMKLL